MTQQIGIVTKFHTPHQNLIRKLGLEKADTYHLHGQPIVGVHLDRLIFTCGYGNLPIGYNQDAELHLKDGAKPEYIACCGRMDSVI